MRIYEAMERPQELIDNLLDVWEASVRATHLFLSDAEIAGIRKYVPAALSGVAHLIIAEEDGYPVAFMGAANGFASKGTNLALNKLNYAILGGVNGKVAASVGTRASNLGCTNLTDDYLASANLLTTKALDA